MSKTKLGEQFKMKYNGPLAYEMTRSNNFAVINESGDPDLDLAVMVSRVDFVNKRVFLNGCKKELIGKLDTFNRAFQLGMNQISSGQEYSVRMYDLDGETVVDAYRVRVKSLITPGVFAYENHGVSEYYFDFQIMYRESDLVTP